jgi:hypothetical protein
MNEWRVVWREIGWPYPEGKDKISTVREGWALEYGEEIEDSNNLYVWIEDEYLAISDPVEYYPIGCYNIPLDLLDKLHNHHWEKEKP